MLDESSAVSVLNRNSFESIWNSTQSEARVNIGLDVVSPRLQKGYVNFRRAVVGLPTTDLGMAYYMPFDLLSVWSSKLQSNTWYNLTKFLNLTQTRLTLYDAGGRMVPLSQAWVYIYEASEELIIFVSKKGLGYIPNGLSTQLYLTAYTNPKIQNPVTAYSYVLSDNIYDRKKQLEDLNTKISNTVPNQITLIQNGFQVDPKGSITYSGGDCLELILDRNVMCVFSVYVDNNTTGYQSTLYPGYREIIHCPKDLNPQNYIVTHDAITLYVRDRATNRGVYFHRTNPVSVEQITHNDISMDRASIDAIKIAMDASDVEVYAIYRNPYDPNVLPYDVNLIRDLYLCPDADIPQHLRGAIDSSLTCWLATTLEASPFLTMMFSNTDDTSTSKLQQYEDGLGFFGVCDILGANIATGTFYKSEVVVSKPFALMNLDTIPFVYLNGRKVPQRSVGWATRNSGSMSIDVDQAYGNDGDRLTVALYTNVPLKPVRFTPTQDVPTITLASDEYDLYQEVNLDTPVTGFKTTATVGYKPIIVGGSLVHTETNTDGTITYAFAQITGAAYVFYPKTFMFGEDVHLDTLIDNKESLVFPITVEASDNTPIPLLSRPCVNVFLNGYSLIESLDYTFTPYVLADGTIVLSDLVLCNRRWLEATNFDNTLELFVHSDVELNADTGYAYSNVLPRTQRPSLWYSHIGTAIVDGVVVTDVDDAGMWLVGTNIRDGAPYRLSSTFINSLNDILDPKEEVESSAILDQIDTYLERQVPQPPAVLPIKQQHQLYSPYLTAIIKDIVDGVFQPVYYSNRVTFLKQFSAYDYLKERDPTLSDNGLVDKRFCAIGAAYAQYSVKTPLLITIIQTLISSMGIGSSGTIGDTLV